MRYYDLAGKQLVDIKKKATSDFWGIHWDANWKGKNNIRDEIIGVKNSFVSKTTKNYLNTEAGIILEGGCGRGDNVASLVNNGSG